MKSSTERASALEAALKSWLPERRVERARRTVQNVMIDDAVPLGNSEAERQFLAVLKVDYLEGEPQQYVLPLAYAVGDEANRLREQNMHAIVARVHIKEDKSNGVLYDALWNSQFAVRLLDIIADAVIPVRGESWSAPRRAPCPSCSKARPDRYRLRRRAPSRATAASCSATS